MAIELRYRHRVSGWAGRHDFLVDSVRYRSLIWMSVIGLIAVAVLLFLGGRLTAPTPQASAPVQPAVVQPAPTVSAPANADYGSAVSKEIAELKTVIEKMAAEKASSIQSVTAESATTTVAAASSPPVVIPSTVKVELVGSNIPSAQPIPVQPKSCAEKFSSDARLRRRCEIWVERR